MEDVTRCKGNYFPVDGTHICWTLLLTSSQMLSSGNTFLDWDNVPSIWRKFTHLGWEKAFFSPTSLKCHCCCFFKVAALYYLWKSPQQYGGQWSWPQRLWIQFLSQDRLPSGNCTFPPYSEFCFSSLPSFLSMYPFPPFILTLREHPLFSWVSFHILLFQSCFLFYFFKIFECIPLMLIIF